MCACINKYQAQQAVVLLPDEQPVGLHVTLPASLVLARQFVRAVFGRELPFFLKDVKHGFEDIHIKTAPDTEPQRFLELPGIDDIIHKPQPSICLIKSSESLA